MPPRPGRRVWLAPHFRAEFRRLSRSLRFCLRGPGPGGGFSRRCAAWCVAPPECQTQRRRRERFLGDLDRLLISAQKADAETGTDGTSWPLGRVQATVSATTLIPSPRAAKFRPGRLKQAPRPRARSAMTAAKGSSSIAPGISYRRNGRRAVNETCGIVSRSSSERSAVIMTPASPRISWIRDTQSTPDRAMGRKARERVI